MILYHGTTEKRAKSIFKNRRICCNSKRFFTQEKNGDGASTDGYVYLSNEILYALYFAYSHSCDDKSKRLTVFKIDVPDSLIEADYDEMHYQDPTGSPTYRYANDLECSLKEYKTCRIKRDIDFESFDMEFTVVEKSLLDKNYDDSFANAGCPYDYVVENYTTEQKTLIKSMKWNK